ncbi:MAG: triose-phosphate isomerase [Candidatus Omnitrophica bacterium]|nr:triose-phosphate isomerase [Candidatus Omnitrophota bacterium]
MPLENISAEVGKTLQVQSSYKPIGGVDLVYRHLISANLKVFLKTTNVDVAEIKYRVNQILENRKEKETVTDEKSGRRILYDHSSSLKRKEGENWILPCFVVGENDEIIGGPYEAVIKPNGDVDTRISSDEQDQKKPSKAFGHVGGDAPKYEVKPDDIELKAGVFSAGESPEQSAFSFRERPDLTGLFNETFGALKLLVEENKRLLSHFNEILKREENKSLDIIFNDDLANINSFRRGKSIVFNGNFVRSLLAMYSAEEKYKWWAKYILMHRMLHELGHTLTQKSFWKEVKEEQSLVKIDLVLYDQLERIGIQKDVINAVFEDSFLKREIRFSSGYYFKFLKVLSLLDKETQDKVIAFYAAHPDITRDKINELIFYLTSDTGEDVTDGIHKAVIWEYINREEAKDIAKSHFQVASPMTSSVLQGARTGEVSVQDINDAGADYVVIDKCGAGESDQTMRERIRMVFEKTDKKVVMRLDVTGRSLDPFANWMGSLKEQLRWIKLEHMSRLVMSLGTDPSKGESLTVMIQKTDLVAAKIREELLKIVVENNELGKEEASEKINQVRIIYEVDGHTAGVLADNTIYPEECLPENLNGVFLMTGVFNNVDVVKKMLVRIYRLWQKQPKKTVFCNPLVMCDCREVYDFEQIHKKLYQLSLGIKDDKAKNLTRNFMEYVDFAAIVPFLHLRKTAWETGKFVYTPSTKTWEGASVKLAVQNLESLDEAYFGELIRKKVTHVILGHSERRKYHAENSESLVEKIKAVVKHGMVPIFCIGEKENEINKWKQVLGKQLNDVLSHLTPDEIASLIIAHEPVYAIEGSTPATPRQIQTTAEFIRNKVLKKFVSDANVRNSIRIIYDGSVKGSNVYEIMGNEGRIKPAMLKALKGMWDVIGALVGGRSLTEDFPKIFQRAADVCKRLGKPAPVIVANWKMGKTSMQDAEESIKTFCEKVKKIRHDVEVIVACNPTQLTDVSKMLFSENQPVSPNAPQLIAREKFLNKEVADFTRWMWENGFATTPEFIDKAIKELHRRYSDSTTEREFEKHGISWYAFLQQAVLSSVFVGKDMIKAAEEFYGEKIGYARSGALCTEIAEKYKLNAYERVILTWIEPTVSVGAFHEEVLKENKGTQENKILNLWRFADMVQRLPSNMGRMVYDKTDAETSLKEFAEKLDVGDELIGDNLKLILKYLGWDKAIEVKVSSDGEWSVPNGIKNLSKSQAIKDKMLVDLYLLIRNIDRFQDKKRGDLGVKGRFKFLLYGLAESIKFTNFTKYDDIDNVFDSRITGYYFKASNYYQDRASKMKNEDYMIDRAISLAQVQYENMFRGSVLSKERAELKNVIDTLKDVKAQGGISAYVKYKVRDIIAAKKAEKEKKYNAETRNNPLSHISGVPSNPYNADPVKEVVNQIRTNLYLPNFSMDAENTIYARLAAQLIRRWVNDSANINIINARIYGIKEKDIGLFVRFLQNNSYTGNADFTVNYEGSNSFTIQRDGRDIALVDVCENFDGHKGKDLSNQLVVVCDRTKCKDNELMLSLEGYTGGILVVDPVNDPKGKIVVTGINENTWIKKNEQVCYYASAFTDAVSHLFKAIGEKYGLKNSSVSYCRPSMAGELIPSNTNVGEGLIRLLPNLGFSKKGLEDKKDFSGQMYDVQVNRGGAVAQLNLDLGKGVTKKEIQGFLRNLAFDPRMKNRVVISEDINSFHSVNVMGKEPVLFIDAGSISIKDYSTFLSLRAWIPEEWSLARSITDLIKKIGVNKELSQTKKWKTKEEHREAVKNSGNGLSYELKTGFLDKIEGSGEIETSIETIIRDGVTVPIVRLKARKSSGIRLFQDMFKAMYGNVHYVRDTGARTHVFKADTYLFSSPYYSGQYVNAGRIDAVRASAIVEFVQTEKMFRRGYPVIPPIGVIVMETPDGGEEYFVMEKYVETFTRRIKQLKNEFNPSKGEVLSHGVKQIVGKMLLKLSRDLGEFCRFLRATAPTFFQMETKVVSNGKVYMDDVPRFHINPEMDTDKENLRRIESFISSKFEELMKNMPEKLLIKAKEEFNKGLRTEKVVIQGGESPVSQALYAQLIGNMAIDPRAIMMVRYDKILHYQNEEFIRLLRDSLPGAVIEGGDTWISINGKRIQVLNSSENKPINSGKYGADTVIYDVAWSAKTQEEALKYLQNGAKRVIFVGASNDEKIKTFISGVTETLGAKDHIIATGTAQDNAVATVTSMLKKKFDIEGQSVFISRSVSPDHTVHDGSGSGTYKKSRAPIGNISAVPEEYGQGLSDEVKSLLGSSLGVEAETGTLKGNIAFITLKLKEKAAGLNPAIIEGLFEQAAREGKLEINPFPVPLGTNDVVGKDKLVFDPNSVQINGNLLTLAVGYDSELFLAAQLRRLIETADTCEKPSEDFINNVQEEITQAKTESEQKKKEKENDKKTEKPIQKDKKSAYVPLPSPEKTAVKPCPEGMEYPAKVVLDLDGFTFDKGKRSSINQMATELIWKWIGNTAVSLRAINLGHVEVRENGKDVTLRELARYLQKELKDGPVRAEISYKRGFRNDYDDSEWHNLGRLYINDPDQKNPIKVFRCNEMKDEEDEKWFDENCDYGLNHWVMLTNKKDPSKQYRPKFWNLHVINPQEDVWPPKMNVFAPCCSENVSYHPSVTTLGASRAISAMYGYDAGLRNIQVIAVSPERSSEVKIKDSFITKTNEGFTKNDGSFVPYRVLNLESPVRKQGNLIKMTFELSKKASVEEINNCFRESANKLGQMKYLEKGMGWTSIDMKNCDAACAFESELTQVDGNLATVYVWASESTLAGIVTDTIIFDAYDIQREDESGVRILELSKTKEGGTRGKTLNSALQKNMGKGLIFLKQPTTAPNSLQLEEKEIIPELEGKPATVVVAGSFGRTGKGFLRTIPGDKNIDLKAVVLTSVKNVKKYIIGLRNDTAYGQLGYEVEYGGIDPEKGWHYIWMGSDAIGWKKVYAFAEKDLGKVKFKELGAEVYLHATGRGLHRLKERAALEAGVTTIFASAPYKGEAVTSVWGVNSQNELEELEDDVISPASCTTGAVSGACKTVLSYLEMSFDLLKGITYHEATNDQSETRTVHRTALRGEPATDTAISTTSGAGTATGLAVPPVMGKADIAAIRTGFGGASLVEVFIRLNPDHNRFKATGFPTAEDINNVLKNAAQGELAGILGFHKGDWKLTSEEVKGMLESGAIDPHLTRVEGNILRFGSWYDNEVAFSRRLADQIPRIAAKRRNIDVSKKTKSKPDASNLAKMEKKEKPKKTKVPGFLDRNLEDTKQLALSLKETIISICSSYSFNNQLVLIFDDTIGQNHEVNVLDIVDALEDLKKDAKVGPILKNLVTIKAAPDSIFSEAVQYIGARQTEVFLFANGDSRPVLKSMETDVHSVYIEEDDFNPRAYHPLTDIITISLAEHLAKSLNGSILNKVREIMKDLNIAQIELGPDGILIFYLLPDAKPYNKGELLREIGVIKRTLKSV